MDSIRKILEVVAKEHPYKIPSRRETYDKYNEGWTDAVDRIESMLPEQTETQCYLGSPCEYQNPDAEIAQLSQEGTTTDTISRQAAIDAIVGCTTIKSEEELREYVEKHLLKNRWSGGILAAINAVKDLPPTQPEERTETHAESHACD